MNPPDPVVGRLVRATAPIKGKAPWIVVAEVNADTVVCDRFADLALARPLGRFTISRHAWAQTVRR